MKYFCHLNGDHNKHCVEIDLPDNCCGIDTIIDARNNGDMFHPTWLLTACTIHMNTFPKIWTNFGPGSSYYNSLNTQVVTGQSGVIGPIGPTGSAGSVGATGATGAIGSAGSGPSKSTGPVGPTLPSVNKNIWGSPGYGTSINSTVPITLTPAQMANIINNTMSNMQNQFIGIDAAVPKKESSKNKEYPNGLNCTKCNVLSNYAIPNKEDGTFECYSCRNY